MRRSLFEQKILAVMNTIIILTLAIVTAIVVVQIVVRKQSWKLVVVRALSLIIACVPVALPLVMTVMMAVSITVEKDRPEGQIVSSSLLSSSLLYT